MSLSSLLLVVVGMMVLVGDCVHGRVDYKCKFGPILFTRDRDGREHHFCSTEMLPPFMNRGEYILARDEENPTECYECVCESDIGMACCESERCPQF